MGADHAGPHQRAVVALVLLEEPEGLRDRRLEQEVVDRPEALRVGVHVHAPVHHQHLVARDVREQVLGRGPVVVVLVHERAVPPVHRQGVRVVLRGGEAGPHPPAAGLAALAEGGRVQVKIGLEMFWTQGSIKIRHK